VKCCLVISKIFIFDVAFFLQEIADIEEGSFAKQTSEWVVEKSVLISPNDFLRSKNLSR
jgi:hypothetical protein